MATADNEQIDFVTFVWMWNKHRGFSVPMPVLHRQIAEWLEETQNEKYRVLQAYRYSGKSYLKDLFIVWNLYKNPNFTCVLFSSGTTLVEKAAIHIKKIITDHPLTAHLVPDTYSQLWRTTQFTVLRDDPKPEPSVLILSMDSEYTGTHCDLLIADDLETATNVRTERSRQKLRHTMSQLASLTKRIIYIGTPHHEDTIYSYLSDNLNYPTAQFPVYVQGTIDEATQRGVPSSPDWHAEMADHPDMTTEEWIEQVKQGGGGSADEGTGHNWWQSQYLLIPTRSTEAVLKWEHIKFIEGEEQVPSFGWNPFRRQDAAFSTIAGIELVKKIAYWDPASAVKNRDESMLTCCAKGSDGELVVLDLYSAPPRHDEHGFEPQLDGAIKFLERNGCNTVIVEANYMDGEIARMLRKHCAAKGKKIVVKDDRRTNQQNKKEYIGMQIEPLVNAGKFYVHKKVMVKSRFKAQFQGFPYERQDDTIDAIAGCIVGLGTITSVTKHVASHNHGPINTYEPTFDI